MTRRMTDTRTTDDNKDDKDDNNKKGNGLRLGVRRITMDNATIK